MKAEIESLTIAAPAADLTSIRVIENDLKSVGRIAVINFAEADELAVLDVVLKEAEDN
jgi:valyl-tRNA synthetase